MMRMIQEQTEKDKNIIYRPTPILPKVKRLNELFWATPSNKDSAIRFIQITRNKIFMRLDRYFITAKELKVMYNTFAFRLHSYDIDPYENVALIEFKRIVA